MDPRQCGPMPPRRWLPRASGDGPATPLAALLSYAAAPRERGWTLHEPMEFTREQGCPARAGMDPFELSAFDTYPWLPRASGDGPRNLVQ